MSTVQDSEARVADAERQVNSLRAELTVLEPELLDALAQVAVEQAEATVRYLVTDQSELTEALSADGRLTKMKGEVEAASAKARPAVRKALDRLDLWLCRIQEPEPDRIRNSSGGHYTLGSWSYAPPAVRHGTPFLPRQFDDAFRSGLEALGKVVARYGYGDRYGATPGKVTFTVTVKDGPAAALLGDYGRKQTKLVAAWQALFTARRDLERSKALDAWSAA